MKCINNPIDGPYQSKLEVKINWVTAWQFLSSFSLDLITAIDKREAVVRVLHGGKAGQWIACAREYFIGAYFTCPFCWIKKKTFAIHRTTVDFHSNALILARWASWDAGSHQARQRQLAVRLCVCVDVRSSRDEHGLHHPNPDKELFFPDAAVTREVWLEFPLGSLSRAPRPSPATSAVHKAARASWVIRGFFPESHRCFLCRPHPRPLSPGHLMRRTESI